MTTERNQSAIREVRDQLSLDYADGEQLNVVTSNLGMDRPPFGFQENAWRALVKAIALKHKQVRNQFRVVLDTLFGPQFTVASGLTNAVEVGDRSCILNDTSKMPQIGSMVFDGGLATEETLAYCFIDRATNTVFLVEPTGFGFAHTAVDQDAEQPVLAIDQDSLTTLILPSTRHFPTTGLPYTVVLGRTEKDASGEQVAEVTAVDQVRGSLTLAAPLTVTVRTMVPSVVQTLLTLPYAVGSTFIVLDDTKPFPDAGHFLLDYKTDEFVAVAPFSVNSVSVASGSLQAAVHNGMYVKFTGNVTGALAGVEALVSTNTTTLITFSAPLGTAPAAGDEFVVLQPPFNVTAGTTTTATVNGGTFTISRQAGNIVVFEGNVTAGLAGIEVDVVDNTDDVLTFGETLGAAPASGDRFRIRARVEYTSNEAAEFALNLQLPIFDMVFPTGARAELLVAGHVVTVGQAQVLGSRWDLFEVTPRQLDIYIPEVLRDVGDLRSASYLHTQYITPVPTSTTVGAVTAGDSVVPITDTSDFPIVGVIVLDPGGVAERVGYYKDNVLATGSIDNTGATVADTETFTLDDGINTAVVFEFDDTNSVVQSDVLRKIDITGIATDLALRDAIVAAINAAPVLELTASPDLLLDGVTLLVHDSEGTVGNVTITEAVADAGFVVSGMSGGVTRVSLATQVLANSFGGATTVDLYEPRYGSTSVLDGDFNTTLDTFPGPYLYEAFEPAPTPYVAQTALAGLLPGPTTVAIDQVVSNTALEVEDATAFDLVNFPYNVRVGNNTGNRETVFVTDVNLRDRVTTTVAVNASSGQLYIEVTALTGTGDAANFPAARGYRVRVDGTNGVLYIVGTDAVASPPRLLLESALEDPISMGADLFLMADVLTVGALGDFHEGKVAHVNRSSVFSVTSSARWPPISSTDISSSELVEPLVSSFDVVSAAGLDVSGGRILVNFGSEQLPQESTLNGALAAMDTAIILVDSSAFPTTYPYVIVIDPGHPLLEERHRVTNNVTNVLTIEKGVLRTHADGVRVQWTPGSPEVIEYDDVTTNTLSFSPAVVLQSTHSPVESVIDSSVDSEPKTNGFDFPFRLPPDIRERIKFLFDLLRAAGVQVTFIDQR